jgi:uncharacterized protein (TIGR00106 family)
MPAEPQPVMAEISVIPIGTGGPSVGAIVAAALRALEAHPEVRHELTAMGTTLTGEMGAVLAACGAMHSAVLAAGAPRCYTIIKLDGRADKAATAEEKVASVRRHLA